MRATSKEDALTMLRNIVSDVEELPGRYTSDLADMAPWDAWARTTAIRVQRVFGPGSSHLQEVERQIEAILERPSAKARKEQAVVIPPLLDSMIVEVSELWEDEPSQAEHMTETREDVEEAPELGTANPEVEGSVFLVHGHDHGNLHTVARFVEGLGLAVTILHERPNEGTTIIEKLETHGNAAYAVVLLTPDDVGAVGTKSQQLMPRARQNVVLELGYFLGRLGRRHVAALVSGDVELPSDYSGVLYIQLDDAGAWKFHLAKELKAAGLQVDTDSLI